MKEFVNKIHVQAYVDGAPVIEDRAVKAFWDAMKASRNAALQ